MEMQYINVIMLYIITATGYSNRPSEGGIVCSWNLAVGRYHLQSDQLLIYNEGLRGEVISNGLK